MPPVILWSSDNSTLLVAVFWGDRAPRLICVTSPEQKSVGGENVFFFYIVYYLVPGTQSTPRTCKSHLPGTCDQTRALAVTPF